MTANFAVLLGKELPIFSFKIIPFWWRFIPLLGTTLATTIGSTIFLPKDIFFDIESDNPKVEHIAILIHEIEHVCQQERVGKIWWNIKYLLVPSFRLQQELCAIKKQIFFLQKHGVIYDINSKALQFASGTYLWMCDYEKAKKLLRLLA